MNINVSSNVPISPNNPFRVPPNTSVTFTTTSASDSQLLTFTGSPFTDSSTQFTVAGSPGVTKTTVSSSGHYPVTVGSRTGELDITASR